MPQKTLGITGLSENLGRDDGIEEPRFKVAFVVNITEPSDC